VTSFAVQILYTDSTTPRNFKALVRQQHPLLHISSNSLFSNL